MLNRRALILAARDRQQTRGTDRPLAHAPDARQRLLDQGAEPVGNTPEEFSRQLRAAVSTWAEAVKASGAKADE